MSQLFQAKGYEDLELSTQIVIQEALNRGVNVEVLDRSDNFIRLSKGGKVEYIRQANQTSKDSYIVALLMGNKLVTKKILAENEIAVPQGDCFKDAITATEAYSKFQGKNLVIKPKSTNFGIGIQFIASDNSKEVFTAAVKESLQFDDSVIVEEKIEGKEYRFLVINGKMLGVIHRVPANVVGDGKSTIKELVEEKNKHPWRGKGYKTPLEKIQLEELELHELAEQSLKVSSIPNEGEVVFLRKNSNISTGGDSLDFTDKVHESYKQIAIKATGAVGAKVCGVDMMIQNPSEPASKNNYAIIELNYNPVLYFHNFPYEGKNRDVGKYVLDLLGF